MLQTSKRLYLLEHEAKPVQFGNCKIELRHVNSKGSVQILYGDHSRLLEHFALQVSEYLVTPDNLSHLTFEQKAKLLASREVPALAVDCLVAHGQVHDADGLFLFGRAQVACVWLDRSDLQLQNVSLNGRNDESDESFFYEKLHRLDTRRWLIEYEGGLILLSSRFKILWHLAKIYNDNVTNVNGDILTISDGETWKQIEISTGRHHDP